MPTRNLFCRPERNRQNTGNGLKPLIRFNLKRLMYSISGGAVTQAFQRTRGVLRLLSFVIHALRESAIPYISLADFDLSVQEIRQELLKHIGPEYDSVIAADITGEDAGAKKVDAGLGDAYTGLKLGSRAATTVFLYSFSGGTESGASLGEIKRSATTTGHPSSALTEAVDGLQEKLFYLQHESGRSYFTNQPNLNSILLTRMENINERAINELEETELKKNLSQGRQLKTFVSPKNGSGHSRQRRSEANYPKETR